MALKGTYKTYVLNKEGRTVFVRRKAKNPQDFIQKLKKKGWHGISNIVFDPENKHFKINK